jgi:Family of unknown function (DUF5996)
MTAESSSRWPVMDVTGWQDTRDTLHLWTQIVGKVRLALAPHVNHWWSVPLYVNSVGLTTSLMPYRDGGVEIIFDFLYDNLHIRTTEGTGREVALQPRSVADFYAEFRARLDELDIDVVMHPWPVEVAEAIPFADDTEHFAYDVEAARAFFTSLVHADRVLSEFRSTFTGKASPVHFFWGAFDLAVTRFSGRPAPLHPGGVPNCPDWVMAEAYSGEVSSCGYWPGGHDEGIFYSYAYPEPAGFDKALVGPSAAFYDHDLREFVLPYRDVRTATDPDVHLMEFLSTSYHAAASLSGWPRQPANGRG